MHATVHAAVIAVTVVVLFILLLVGVMVLVRLCYSAYKQRNELVLLRKKRYQIKLIAEICVKVLFLMDHSTCRKTLKQKGADEKCMS